MAAKTLGIRCIVPVRSCLFQSLTYSTHDQRSEKFDKSLLDILVCPLSKERLRYDEARNELICDKLNVAYPIINGIPNLIPTDATLIKESTKTK